MLPAGTYLPGHGGGIILREIHLKQLIHKLNLSIKKPGKSVRVARVFEPVQQVPGRN
jgi:hypothetical protein